MKMENKPACDFQPVFGDRIHRHQKGRADGCVLVVQCDVDHAGFIVDIDLRADMILLIRQNMRNNPGITDGDDFEPSGGGIQDQCAGG